MSDATPRELFDAIGELALAIKPHHMDSDQRRRIKAALHALVDHIIAVGERKRGEHQPKDVLRPVVEVFAPIPEDSVLLSEHEAVMASVKLGGWMSAALDDPAVCDAMKADINRWFSAGFLYLNEVRELIEADRAELVAEIVAWLRRQEDIAFDRMRNAATTDRMNQYAGAGTAIQSCANLLASGEWKA